MGLVIEWTSPPKPMVKITELEIGGRSLRSPDLPWEPGRTRQGCESPSEHRTTCGHVGFQLIGWAQQEGRREEQHTISGPGTSSRLVARARHVGEWSPSEEPPGRPVGAGMRYCSLDLVHNQATSVPPLGGEGAE